MRQLRHRHLLQLLEVFETENTIYLCTEYLKGGQLYTRTMVLLSVIQNQRLEPVQIHQYLRQLLEALVAMKRKGIIHRDIKPENIVFR
jgi:calcium-dependent protein kinase